MAARDPARSDCRRRAAAPRFRSERRQSVRAVQAWISLGWAQSLSANPCQYIFWQLRNYMILWIHEFSNVIMHGTAENRGRFVGVQVVGFIQPPDHPACRQLQRIANR